MTKKVFVSLCGTQVYGEGAGEPVEVTATADYYYKNGRHYILYDEAEDGGRTKNTIRLSRNLLDITKRGALNVHMVFEPGKRHEARCDTPYGSLLVGMETTKLAVCEAADGLTATVEYALEMNGAHLADCTLVMQVQSKMAGE